LQQVVSLHDLTKTWQDKPPSVKLKIHLIKQLAQLLKKDACKRG